jgi:hypothetical protein
MSNKHANEQTFSARIYVGVSLWSSTINYFNKEINILLL